MTFIFMFLPLFLIGFLVALLGVHAFIVATSLYYVFWWLDMVLHFAGGIWLGSVGFYLLYRLPALARFALPRFFCIIAAACFAALIGVLWEFFEFAVDYFIPFLGEGLTGKALLADTLSDLFFDISGAIISCSVLIWRIKRTE